MTTIGRIARPDQNCPTDKEIARSQRRMELLIGKEWLMEGVFCLDCGRPWREWEDREGDHCGCRHSPEYLDAIEEHNSEKAVSERATGWGAGSDE